MCASRMLLRVAVFAAVLWIPSRAHAGWPHDPSNGNVAVCAGAGDQLMQRTISDGVGGVIVVWSDTRSGNVDIYAQRISSTGALLWGPAGIPICTAATDQLSPEPAPDGNGGVVVAWYDSRNGNIDIYAQRVSAAGTVLWATNGVALCTATGTQVFPNVSSDGLGGAIVCWRDERSGISDIYAQRVNAAGVPQWAANGAAVCVATGAQESQAIVSDAANGALVVWTDFRNGGVSDVYAQRVSASGVPLWTANGVAICLATNEQLESRLCMDGSGGAMIVWTDYRGGSSEIYAQRVSPSGAIQWAANGALVCTAPFGRFGPNIAADGSGGALVAWIDFRSGVSADIFGQRITTGGASQWAANGVALCTAPGAQYQPIVLPDDAGGAIVTWYDLRNASNGNNDDVYAQRVSPAGVRLWAQDGTAISTPSGNQGGPGLVSDGAGGAIIVWGDSRTPGRNLVFAQRVERFGKLGNPEPLITSVKDVRNDQGGLVKLSWAASYLDIDPTFGVLDYRIWRSVPTRALANPAFALRRGITEDADEAAMGGKLWTGPSAAADYAWELIGSQPCGPVASYSFVASTTADSLGTGNPRTAFMVQARASSVSGSPYWFSAPDSGYSVDDLAPLAPAALSGHYTAGTTHLSWNANQEADLAGYRLYRGSTISFVPGPSSLVGTATETGYTDPAGAPYFYKLTAVDVHGNESPASTLTPSGTLDVPGAGAVLELAFAPVSPNPVLDVAALSFALPRPGRVRLEVLDVNGRRVARVAEGEFTAGRHVMPWRVESAHSQAVAAGVYLCRLEFEGRTLTRRMIVTR